MINIGLPEGHGLDRIIHSLFLIPIFLVYIPSPSSPPHLPYPPCILSPLPLLFSPPLFSSPFPTLPSFPSFRDRRLVDGGGLFVVCACDFFSFSCLFLIVCSFPLTIHICSPRYLLPVYVFPPPNFPYHHHHQRHFTTTPVIFSIYHQFWVSCLHFMTVAHICGTAFG